MNAALSRSLFLPPIRMRMTLLIETRDWQSKWWNAQDTEGMS